MYPQIGQSGLSIVMADVKTDQEKSPVQKYSAPDAHGQVLALWGAAEQLF